MQELTRPSCHLRLDAPDAPKNNANHHARTYSGKQRVSPPDAPSNSETKQEHNEAHRKMTMQTNGPMMAAQPPTYAPMQFTPMPMAPPMGTPMGMPMGMWQQQGNDKGY